MTRTFKISNGDVVRSYTNSNYEFVEDREKARQDVKCVLTTSFRDSTGLGCGLEEVVGKDTENPISAFSIMPTAFGFQNRVMNGLNILKTMQRKYQFSQRTRGELIKSISPVRIRNIASDARNFRWRVDVYTLDAPAPFTLGGTAPI